jgi:hypothetical protein
VIVIPDPNNWIQIPYHFFQRRMIPAAYPFSYSLLYPFHRTIGRPYGAVQLSLRTLSVRGAQTEMDSLKVREISKLRLFFSSYDHQAA